MPQINKMVQTSIRMPKINKMGQTSIRMSQINKTWNGTNEHTNASINAYSYSKK